MNFTIFLILSSAPIPIMFSCLPPTMWEFITTLQALSKNYSPNCMSLTSKPISPPASLDSSAKGSSLGMLGVLFANFVAKLGNASKILTLLISLITKTNKLPVSSSSKISAFSFAAQLTAGWWSIREMNLEIIPSSGIFDSAMNSSSVLLLLADTVC